MQQRPGVWSNVALLFLSALPVAARAQAAPYVVKPVAQKKVKQLPEGPLHWRVENFETLTAAKAAWRCRCSTAGPRT